VFILFQGSLESHRQKLLRLLWLQHVELERDGPQVISDPRSARGDQQPTAIRPRCRQGRWPASQAASKRSQTASIGTSRVGRSGSTSSFKLSDSGVAFHNGYAVEIVAQHPSGEQAGDAAADDQGVLAQAGGFRLRWSSLRT
jgi:hypothetical protein